MNATAEELIARLRRNPDDASAYAALRAHYQRIGDYPSLVNLLEGWASRCPDHGAAAHAFFEAGELAWGALADRARSMRLYERALERNPAHLEAGLRLESIYEEGGDQRRVAELLERRADALERAQADPRNVAAIHHRLGEIWQHAFQRADKAIVHYRKAFELDPTLVPAIYAAREIYRRAGNVTAAATLCDLEAKAEPDPVRKVALLRELAHVRAHELGDLEGGVVALKRALGIAPGELEVMQDLAQIYLLRAAHASDPMIADADRHRAADLLYQIAQKVPPAEAVAHLETALDSAPEHEGALGLLERIAERVGHFELLPKRWVAFLARAPDAPGARERRKRLANAYLEAGQVDYAITCLEWLLEEGDPDAAAQLVDLYRHTGREQDALRALSVATAGLPPAERIPRLREMVAMSLAAGDEEGAVQSARQILEIDPADPEALATVEEHYRKRGEWGELRALLLAAARVPGLSVEARKTRLREVAAISEQRLGDVDGAISAWKGVAALDPADREARSALMRVLEQYRRWDDLVVVLEREAISALEPAVKADVYRRLADIHRRQRGDLQQAIAALRNLRDLVPHDPEGRDALCDVLLEAGVWSEGAALLRERIEQATPPRRAELLRVLACTLEERLGDEEGAFAAWVRLLEDEPGDREALGRMEAIDERSGRYERLLTTLSYRADVEEGPERAAIFKRMGQIADEKLRDLAQAAELYTRAHDLAPHDESILDALCEVYERAARYKDLVLLLRDRARMEGNVLLRAALYRRIARTLRERVGNDEGAAEAYREVLAAGEDREALFFLRDRARARDDLVTFDELTARLAAVAVDSGEKRELLLERAELLADRLGRPHDAIDVLRYVVREVEPQHVPALTKLADLCAQIGDRHGLADALERTLAVVEDADLRVPLAQRLADLYQHELGDRDRAISALYAWADADLTAPDPLRRLIALLEPAERWRDLVIALDALADLVTEEPERGAVVRRAADLAFRRLGEVEGAWERLAPRVGEGDAEAEAQIRELARAAGLGKKLVELYVSLAEGASEPATKKRRWIDAAQANESYLQDAPAALEAYLKAFAVDLHDLSILDQVDRLAVQAGAWARLSQVYETLIRRAEDKGAKIELLLRHAALLDQEAEDPSGALDRVLRACSLAPSDDRVLEIAEDLAPRAGRTEELLIVYDRRRANAKDDAGRVEALLRAAHLSADALENRQQALGFLAQAVALSVRSRELGATIETAVRAIDRDLGTAGSESLLRGLVDVYAALAEDMEADPRGGAMLLLRASAILERDLHDADGAWRALLRATSFAPGDDTALDALESLAQRMGRLSALEQHLGKLVEDALDSQTAAKLLRRRGALLERLDRASDAADVYAHLKNVAPHDAEARAALRRALRRAERHQDLLLALDADLMKAKGDRAQELALRKEIALTWERGLRNRWEAIEAWRQVAALAPDDPDARDALARLEPSKAVRDRADDSLELALAPTGLALAIEPASTELTDPGIDALSEPGLESDLIGDAAEGPPPDDEGEESFELETPAIPPAGARVRVPLDVARGRGERAADEEPAEAQFTEAQAAGGALDHALEPQGVEGPALGTSGLKARAPSEALEGQAPSEALEGQAPSEAQGPELDFDSESGSREPGSRASRAPGAEPGDRAAARPTHAARDTPAARWTERREAVRGEHAEAALVADDGDSTPPLEARWTPEPLGLPEPFDDVSPPFSGVRTPQHTGTGEPSFGGPLTREPISGELISGDFAQVVDGEIEEIPDADEALEEIEEVDELEPAVAAAPAAPPPPPPGSTLPPPPGSRPPPPPGSTLPPPPGSTLPSPPGSTRPPPPGSTLPPPPGSRPPPPPGSKRPPPPLPPNRRE
jgi:tetratricopeptide (TPR) repeat protein